ncbi:MAG: stress response translation initiation inhibitor YciH [Acidobacteriota bacterium]|nr:stress response translation initiation inhibitor YciH [Acidobacteriota bacterium]
MNRRGGKNGGGGLVYSSELGSTCPVCEQPLAGCRCRESTGARAAFGPVRVYSERKGRHGKTVTVILGLPLDGAALRNLAGELKRMCGSGGTVKDGRIEIQGEHRAALLAELRRRGWAPKG